MFDFLNDIFKTKKKDPVVNFKRRSNIKYVTPVFDLKNDNVVYPDNKTQKEIQDLYAEIKELQAKNREKINRNKITYHIS